MQERLKIVSDGVPGAISLSLTGYDGVEKPFPPSLTIKRLTYDVDSASGECSVILHLYADLVIEERDALIESIVVDNEIFVKKEKSPFNTPMVGCVPEEILHQILFNLRSTEGLKQAWESLDLKTVELLQKTWLAFIADTILHEATLRRPGRICIVHESDKEAFTIQLDAMISDIMSCPTYKHHSVDYSYRDNEYIAFITYYTANIGGKNIEVPDEDSKLMREVLRDLRESQRSP